MKILIDADGCPVTGIAVRVAKKMNIACTIICDTAHWIQYEGSETIIVDKGADSADYRIVNLVLAGNLVITQDYGLAAMCLSRKAIVLHQDGKQYSEDNISGLLEFRAASAKIRQSGGRMKGPAKRTAQQDQAFENALIQILEHEKEV